jgi:hypothetical protein
VSSKSKQIKKRSNPRAEYDPPVAYARLQAMIAALESTSEIAPEMRREIVDALDCFYITLVIEERDCRRGRPVSSAQRMNAWIVHQLVTAYGAQAKAAACAVMVNGDQTSVDARLRCYRKMKAGDEFGEVLGSSSSAIVKVAAARLPRRKSGNKSA